MPRRLDSKATRPRRFRRIVTPEITRSHSNASPGPFVYDPRPTGRSSDSPSPEAVRLGQQAPDFGALRPMSQKPTSPPEWHRNHVLDGSAAVRALVDSMKTRIISGLILALP